VAWVGDVAVDQSKDQSEVIEMPFFMLYEPTMLLLVPALLFAVWAQYKGQGKLQEIFSHQDAFWLDRWTSCPNDTPQRRHSAFTWHCV